MKYIFYLGLVLIFVGCKARRVSLESGGYSVNPIDTSLAKNIKVLQFGKSVGVIFPAPYGKAVLNKYEQEGTAYFTPDTNLIKRVNKEIDLQYYAAAKRLWLGLLYGTNNLSGFDNPGSISAEHGKAADDWATKRYANWLKNSEYYDRQFLGYIKSDGEKVIEINASDFREDPNHMRQLLYSSWITGWHGWFYSNSFGMKFYVRRNLLLLN